MKEKTLTLESHQQEKNALMQKSEHCTPKYVLFLSFGRNIANKQEPNDSHLFFTATLKKRSITRNHLWLQEYILKYKRRITYFSKLALEGLAFKGLCTNWIQVTCSKKDKRSKLKPFISLITHHQFHNFLRHRHFLP